MPRAFVVDNQPGMRELMTLMLRRLHFETVVAADARHALANLEGDHDF